MPRADLEALFKAARIFTADTRMKILAAAGKRMGVAAESVVPPAPPPSGKPLEKYYIRTSAFGRPTKPYKSKFKSDAQAYYVLFVLAKANKIPTVRNGQLLKSITSAISDLTGSSVTVRIGTALPFAPLVIGDDDEQSHYHQDTWWQLHKVMADNTDFIETEGDKALSAGIARELSDI